MNELMECKSNVNIFNRSWLSAGV